MTSVFMTDIKGISYCSFSVYDVISLLKILQKITFSSVSHWIESAHFYKGSGKRCLEDMIELCSNW